MTPEQAIQLINLVQSLVNICGFIMAMIFAFVLYNFIKLFFNFIGLGLKIGGRV